MRKNHIKVIAIQQSKFAHHKDKKIPLLSVKANRKTAAQCKASTILVHINTSSSSHSMPNHQYITN